MTQVEYGVDLFCPPGAVLVAFRPRENLLFPCNIYTVFVMYTPIHTLLEMLSLLRPTASSASETID